MKKFFSSQRAKNPMFWIGMVSVILTAAGISPETVTSWPLLAENILSILSNPFMLSTVVLAICGVAINPTTPGLKDK